MKKHPNIMGTRGIPANHGGYETFAAHLAPCLVARGRGVTVYCRDDDGVDGMVDDWNGVERAHFVPRRQDVPGAMEFEAQTVRHGSKRPGIDLVPGYDTACLNTLQRLCGRRITTNMDGIERHPGLRGPRPIATIPYGADAVTDAAAGPLLRFGVEPGRYLIVTACPVPENSILEIIAAFSRRPRGVKLLVFGAFGDETYHNSCRAAASDEVVFPGAIFDPDVVQSLRFHARAYVHGHTMGDTNPSLCEALSAGNAIIAHDNRFNRRVAGDGQFYFDDPDSCETMIDRVLSDNTLLAAARAWARTRHAEAFPWERILRDHQLLLEGML